jgi:resuscitation-promoting factor RpfB
VRLVALIACIGMALRAQPLLAQTAQAGQCDPIYSGQCVPIASDVDCAGGKGNGPAHVSGSAYVVGADIYGLDREKDGVGCE